MKPIRMKKRIKILLNLLWLVPLSGLANSNETVSLPYEETKSIRKSFAANSATTVEIINKYGDITAETWEKDSVRFEVVITARASKLSSARELFDMADVKFTANSSVVLATLLWGENVNAFKRGSVEMTLAAGSSQEIRIDYKVYLPAANTLKIENRFGDIFLPDLKGKTYISLWHGNLRGETVKTAKSLSVKYGDIKLKSISDGEIEILFGDIEIENAGDLQINASSSTVEIENAEDLNLEGTNGKFRIENAEKVTMDILLSDVRVRKLKKKLTGVTKMCDIKADQIESVFTSIDLNSYGGEINLGFDPSSSFLFEVSLEKPKTFHVDETFTVKEDKIVSNMRMIEGKIGQSDQNKVNIQAKSCSVYFSISD